MSLKQSAPALHGGHAPPPQSISVSPVSNLEFEQLGNPQEMHMNEQKTAKNRRDERIAFGVLYSSLAV